jgi:hypothetical protein
MEQVHEVREVTTRPSYQHVRKIMDITELCEHIVGKTIVAAEAHYSDSVLILELDDDTYIEIACDSINSEVPALDD